MSSEGSVSTTSSGIRQFGLYRTIDARTEEFLRLSRKRQIRQGCACAAISTAITVTVVISIALIYEYSIFYESNSKTALKPDWLSLMNKSADGIPFEAKLDKAKINLDPMYVQFLPLILKTLKKNKYFNKILEEDSSQIPKFERHEQQEETYTKNIFSDTRNWMRVPTSRLYAIEYKTSPIVYFKNPSRNIDHFRKIRRIRDYQRIMNYVDKMINERVTYGSTLPMLKNTYGFHTKFPLFTHTTPIANVMEHVPQKVEHKNQKYSDRVPSDHKKNCRFPKKMGELLNKLIKSLQTLIPDFINSETKTSISCEESHLHTIGPVKNALEHAILKTPSETSTRNYGSNDKFSKISISFRERNSFTSTEYIQTPESVTEPLEIFKIQSMPTNQSALKTNTVSKTLYSLKPLPSKINYSLSSIIRLLQPSLYNNVDPKIQDKKTNTFTTTINQFLEATDPKYDFQESTTKPMTTLTSTIKGTTFVTMTVKDFILNRKDSNTTKSFLTLPTFSDNQYEDVDTTPDIVNRFKDLDSYSIELVKNKFLANSKERKNTKEVTRIKINDDLTKQRPDPSEHQFTTETMNILKKMGALAFATTESSYNINRKFDNNTAEANSSQNLQSKQEQQLKIEDITLEEEVDKAFTDDMIPEYNTKNTINKFNASNIINKTLSKDSTELYQWELIENEDGQDKESKVSKSMVPESRSSYLEIQRNDWKRDENQDYDNNINNYFFE